MIAADWNSTVCTWGDECASLFVAAVCPPDCVSGWPRSVSRPDPSPGLTSTIISSAFVICSLAPLFLARTGPGALSVADPRPEIADTANRSNAGGRVLAASTESCAYVIEFIAIHGRTGNRTKNYDDMLNN